MVIDPLPFWDFEDPVTSERRFREQAERASSDEAEAWLTQAARALGLQGRYDEGHALLDGLVAEGPVVAAHAELERGRLLCSTGAPEAARPHFEEAAALAADAGAEALRVDALHMVALAATPADQVPLTLAALEVARASRDQAARDWDASLLNNLGMARVDAGDLVAALEAFEEALQARRRIDDDTRTRVARWMVGWCLRLLGRTDEALEVQRGLRDELRATGGHDVFVDEELALLEAGSPPRSSS